MDRVDGKKAHAFSENFHRRIINHNYRNMPKYSTQDRARYKKYTMFLKRLEHLWFASNGKARFTWR